MSRDATPLMQQYLEIKARHADAILLFRMGDFYEMFYEDAETASRVLGLTLTSRNNGGASEVPLAGVPVKAVNEYLRRLVQGGFRVAICEQVEDPRLAKGIVRREVVETITPGAAFADDHCAVTRPGDEQRRCDEGPSLRRDAHQRTSSSRPVIRRYASRYRRLVAFTTSSERGGGGASPFHWPASFTPAR